MSGFTADDIHINTTDRALLATMADEKRHDAKELSHALDEKRQYMNTRLSYLRHVGLVERVPHSNGMYEITDAGQSRIAQQQADT